MTMLRSRVYGPVAVGVGGSGDEWLAESDHASDSPLLERLGHP